jgi:NTP pyrophosphatase (non-canonical NTP hydrolase)
MKEIEIINHYGYRHQIKKLAEEQYELIEALFEEDEDHITEEIADCLLLINQFKAYYKIKDKDIQKVYDYKIARQEGRIADEIQLKL